MLYVRREIVFGPDIETLLAEADAYSAALYPVEARYPVDAGFLAAPHVRFLVARIDGRAVGCVALVVGADRVAELKRLILLPEVRGHGFGSRLLLAVEMAAAQDGVRVIRLETGPLNEGALRLYQRHGYGERGPFGGYEAGPHSVFMEKRLGPASG